MRLHWSIHITAAFGLVGAAAYFAVPANAEPDTVLANCATSVGPAVCDTLTKYPTLPGVQGVMAGVKADSGFTDYEVGEVVALAVIDDCPRFVPLLQRFADTYAGPTRTGTAV